MPVLPLRGQITRVTSHPVFQLRQATGVLTGIHSCAVELLVLAVLQDRNLWVVQVKSGRLRADLGQLSEVVARRWRGGRPLQRAAPPPRIVQVHFRVLPALPHVPEED